MNESEFRGGIPHESKDYVADELPKIEHSALDKDAITERILDKVIGAAENNRPLEREYERGHEVKDAKQAMPSYAPMQSVGDIIQNQGTNSQQSWSTAVNPSEPQQTHQQVPLLLKPQSAVFSYRSAIRFGFIAALVLASIIFGAIALF